VRCPFPVRPGIPASLSVDSAIRQSSDFAVFRFFGLAARKISVL
jgi:hypothetical protein